MSAAVGDHGWREQRNHEAWLDQIENEISTHRHECHLAMYSGSLERKIGGHPARGALGEVYKCLIGQILQSQPAPFGERVSIQRRYEKPIPSLPPGQIFDNLYQDSENNDHSVPDTIIVSFDYRDDRNRRYFDKYELSTYALRLQTGAYPSTNSGRG